MICVINFYDISILFLKSLHLFPRVNGIGVHLAVELRAHEVQGPVIAESAPLRVDEQIWLPRLAIEQLTVLRFLNVASIASSTCIR